MEITARSTVERGRAAPLPDSLGAGAWEEIHSWRELSGYWDFTHPGASARPSPPLTAFVDEAGIEPSGDPLESLLRLSDILHHSFQYVPGSTSVVSPIEHILESRQGVCQDYAPRDDRHCPVRGASRPATSRATCMSTVKATKWRRKQPLMPGWNAACPARAGLALTPPTGAWLKSRHVRVGIGRDYRDVTPVRGVFVGGGTTRLEVDVRVLAGRR